MRFKDFLKEEPTITTASAGDTSTEGGDANYAKKVGKLLRRNDVKKQKVQYTSKDSGHKHSFEVCINGNGQTSKDGEHIHQIVKWKVQKEKEHTHEIRIKR